MKITNISDRKGAIQKIFSSQKKKIVPLETEFSEKKMQEEKKQEKKEKLVSDMMENVEEGMASETKKDIEVWKELIVDLVKKSSINDHVNLPEKDKICVQVTSYAYLEPEKRPYQIGDFYLEPLYNSIFHCIYLNHKKKICIIGYRGTDPKNISDIMSDAQLILGVNAIDPRVKGSLELFDQVRKTHEEYEKRICWHSLWGTLCYIVAKHRKVNYCCTFNPGSAPNKIFILMLKDTISKKRWTKTIKTYKIVWDLISFFSYVGETKSFFVPNRNLLELHSLSNFLE